MPTTAFSIADAVDLVLEPAASTFRWHGKEITLPMGGRFNVSNALAAATAAAVLGVPDATIASALTGNPPIPGRFEVIDEGQPFSAIVDYAHTPDGLERLLEASRPSGYGGGARGRLIVVFGCGGDRDRSKRPQMGEIASRVADVVVITSDNPRSEDPSEIIEQVRAGAVAAREIVIEPDRRKAIGFALALARGGDVVMVAGKGHERGQERDGVVTPFDDREEVREGLASLGFAGTTGHRDLLDLPRKDRRPCV